MALTQHDAKIVMGMLARGDNHHDIAAWFGENQGRVADVESGRMYGILPAAPAADLPPKGSPGPKGRRMRAFASKALKALEDGNVAEAEKALKDGLAAYDRNEY